MAATPPNPCARTPCWTAWYQWQAGHARRTAVLPWPSGRRWERKRSHGRRDDGDAESASQPRVELPDVPAFHELGERRIAEQNDRQPDEIAGGKRLEMELCAERDVGQRDAAADDE